MPYLGPTLSHSDSFGLERDSGGVGSFFFFNLKINYHNDSNGQLSLIKQISHSISQQSLALPGFF